MGNNASNNNKGSDAASGTYSPTPRDGNIYDQSFPPPAPSTARYSGGISSTNHHSSLTHSMSSASPPVPPRALERRSHTMVVRERRPLHDSPVSFVWWAR